MALNKADFLGKYPSWTSEASGSACSEKYRDRDGLQVADYSIQIIVQSTSFLDSVESQLLEIIFPLVLFPISQLIGLT